jgi:polysaccharide export outer membrane protein
MALALANKFALNSHDLVYVDASDLVTWNRIMQLIVPTSSIINNGASAVRNIELIELQGW